MNRFIFLFAALLAVAAAKGAIKKCPSVSAKFPFDDAKFAGDWNVIAYLPKPGYSVKKCANMTIVSSKGEDGITVNTINNFVYNGEPKTIESISFSKGESKGAMLYTVFKKGGDTKFSPVMKYTIVATDYDTYALSIACRTTFNEETKEFGRELYSDVLARDKTMSESTLKTLKSILTSYDIEYDSIKTVVHDC